MFTWFIQVRVHGSHSVTRALNAVSIDGIYKCVDQEYKCPEDHL